MLSCFLIGFGKTSKNASACEAFLNIRLGRLGMGQGVLRFGRDAGLSRQREPQTENERSMTKLRATGVSEASEKLFIADCPSGNTT